LFRPHPTARHLPFRVSCATTKGQRSDFRKRPADPGSSRLEQGRLPFATRRHRLQGWCRAPAPKRSLLGLRPTC
jgi:hypothetical protein